MVLISGEALIDMLPRPDQGKGTFLAVPGGSPFNVAMALGRLGVAVQFLGRISRDHFGEELAQTLQRSRVDISLCPRTDALSTLGFVTFDSESGNARYAFYTDGTAGCVLEPADLPTRLPADVECLHFGSFSLAVEPIGTTLEELLSKHGAGRAISVDPNIRPFLIRDPVHFKARLEHFLNSAHIIKVSLEDLEWIEPGLSPERYAARRLGRGARLVVVTRGAEGAMAFSQSASAEVPAEAVKVADTVGAGDSFQAALLRWLV